MNLLAALTLLVLLMGSSAQAAAAEHAGAARALSAFGIANLAARRQIHFDNAASKLQKKGDIRLVLRLNAVAALSAADPRAEQFRTKLKLRRAQTRLLHDMLNASGFAEPKRFKYLPFLAIKVKSPESLEQLRKKLDVADIQEDSLAAPTLATSTPLINAPQMWSAGITGSGQTVAILDTGVDKSHPFLAGKVVAEACFSTHLPGNGVTSNCPGSAGSSTASGSAAPCAASGCNHGTHVAGIAAGKGSSFSGVAKDANIIAVQVFSTFTTTSGCGGSAPCVLSYVSDQLRALEHVYGLRSTYSIAAVNLSLGGGAYASACDSDTAYKNMVDLLKSAGIATVIAAGNNGYVNQVSSPGCISSAVTVGATTSADAIAPFSNISLLIDILAPGVGITSSVPNGQYLSMSGTSMATPHVVGAFAVMRQRYPNDSVDQILEKIKATGPRISDSRSGGTMTDMVRLRLTSGNILSVVKQGTGGGTVTTSDSSIACGSTCAKAYSSSTAITLTATPSTGSEFTGWGGACSGTATTCSITVNADQDVTASFALKQSVDLAVAGITVSPSIVMTGQTFSASVTVKNNGTSTISGAKLGVWLNDGGTKACSGSPDSQIDVNGLGAGQSTVVTLSNLSATETGVRTLQAFIDYGCAIAETDEGNNRATAEYAISSIPRPDFAVTSIVIDPKTPTYLGKAYNAKIIVQNVGSVAGIGGKLQIWPNADGIAPCGAMGTHSAVLPKMNPGASITVSVPGLTSNTLGENKLLAFADANCGTAENDEANNQAALAYLVTEAPKPDFVISAMEIDAKAAPYYGSGRTYGVRVTVTNQGNLAGSPGAVQIWHDADGPMGCKARSEKSGSVAMLQPGASATVLISGITAASTGAKKLWAYADAACTVIEQNEDNNQAGLTYTVTESPKPDFVISDLVIDPKTPAYYGKGWTYNVRATVTNQGNLAGSPGSIQLWHDGAGPMGCKTKGEKSASAGVIQPGASATVLISGITAASTGEKTLWAYADAACTVQEQNDDNNQASLSYTVVDSPKPDFVVSGLVIDPATPAYYGKGWTYNAQVTITNQGNLAGSPGAVMLWANNTGANCKARGEMSGNVATLQPGASATVTVKGLTAPGAGSLSLLAFTEAGCAVLESNDDNNQQTLVYEVTDAPKPDFVITGLWVDPKTPAKLGKTFNAQVQIANQGNWKGAPGLVQIWMDGGDSPGCLAVGNKSATASAILNPGASTIVTVSGLKPTSGGSKILAAMVNSTCANLELDNGNNAMATGYAVLAQ